MSADLLTCPRCQSTVIVKNDKIHNGRQNFKCFACSRQFVQHPTKKVIGQDTRDLIDAFVVREVVIGRDCQSYWSEGSNGCRHMSMLNTHLFQKQ